MRIYVPPLAAFAASIFPFVAFWLTSPDFSRPVLLLLPLAVVILGCACALAVALAGTGRLLPTIGAAWLALALWVAGAAATLAFLLTAGAAVALGARMLRRLEVFTAIERAVLAYLVGLAMLVTVLSPVLSLSVHYPAVYAGLCFLCVAWHWRSLMELGQGLREDWVRWRREAPRGVTGALAVGAALLWIWGAWGGFTPILAFDDLGGHLRLAYELLVRHQYSFAVEQQVWAASPWASDLIFAVPFVMAQGSEGVKTWLSASYHFSTSVLLLGLLARRLPLAPALLFLLGYLSVPLVMALNHTLHTEALTAALMTAIFAVWALQRGNLAAGPGIAVCLLLALVGAIKASNLVGSLLLGVMWLPWLWRGERARPRWVLASLAALAAVLVPYLTAWVRTGNPVLPLFNAVFKSPFFPPSNFSNALFAGHFDLGLFPGIFLHGTKYLETGTDVVAGLALFFLLPAGVILVAWRSDLERRVALALAIMFSLVLLASQQYARYTFPVTALALFGLSRVWDTDPGLPLPAARAWHIWWTLLLLVAIGVGTVAMPRAFWQTTRGALVGALRPDAHDRGVELFAPERSLNAVVNRDLGVHGRVLYLASPFGADLYGTPIYPVWWNPKAAATASAIRDDDGARAFVREMRLTHVMLQDPTGIPAVPPLAATALERYARANGRVVATSGSKTLIALNDDLVWSRTLWTQEPGNAAKAASAALFIFGQTPVKRGELVRIEMDGSCDDPAARPSLDVIWSNARGGQVSATSRVESCVSDRGGQQARFTFRIQVEAPVGATGLFLRMGGATPAPVRFSAAQVRGLAAP